jgi:hypothetical protein
MFNSSDNSIPYADLFTVSYPNHCVSSIKHTQNSFVFIEKYLILYIQFTRTF